MARRTAPISPPISVPLGVEVTAQLTTPDNDIAEYTLGYKSDTQISPADAAIVAAEALSSLTPALANSLAQDWHIIGYIVSDTLIPRSTSVPVSTGTPVAGSIPQDSEAANVASVISWHTGQAGRYRRGRTYLGGIQKPGVVGSIINGGQVSAEVATADAVRGFSPTAFPLVKAVISHSTGIPYPVTSYVIDTITDSVRDRLPGRGR